MGTRIGIFDPYPHNAFLLSEILSQRGYQVLTFSQNPECPADLRQLGVDLVILGDMQCNDAEIPAMLRHLRICASESAVPVLIWTTQFEALGNPGLINGPFLSVLPKPSDVQQLLQYVKQLLVKTEALA